MEMPWKKQIKGLELLKEAIDAPAQTLSIEHVYGYRSYDCRNNIKWDMNGKLVYHQAAIGIVVSLKGNASHQSYLMEHQDDISCLDVCGDLAATGEVGSKPMVALWNTKEKEGGFLKGDMTLSKELTHSVGNICISKSKKYLAVNCNDEDHKIVIYDI